MKFTYFILFLSILAFTAYGNKAYSNSTAPLISLEKKLSLKYELPVLTIGKSNSKYSLKNLEGMVIINFWSSWCGPCVDEVDHLNQFQNFIENNNLEIKIIAINIFDEKEDAKSFILKYKPNFLLLFDDSKMIPIDFAVSGVPETYFIKDNNIKFKYVGKITKEKLVEGFEKLKASE